MNGFSRPSLGVCAAGMVLVLGPSAGFAQRGPVTPLVDANHKRMDPEVDEKGNPVAGRGAGAPATPAPGR